MIQNISYLNIDIQKIVASKITPFSQTSSCVPIPPGTLTSLPWHHTAQLGGVDWRVWVSGMVAGVARGLVVPGMALPGDGWRKSDERCGGKRT